MYVQGYFICGHEEAMMGLVNLNSQSGVNLQGEDNSHLFI
jgi:hypothetical protein